MIKERIIQNSVSLPAKNRHLPVLLNEVLETLAIKEGETVLDATINGGGHSREIALLLGPSGSLIGLDEDRNALERARANLSDCRSKIFLEETNFRNLDKALAKLGISKADKILFDFGISSDQLELSGRGFSFQRDEPLLMTMSVIPKLGQKSAIEIVNGESEEELAKIIREYGEERYWRKIAKGIISARKKDIIRTTNELVEIVLNSVPFSYRHGKIHPATKTFQAIRIAVNDELSVIREGLIKASEKISTGGRIAAISFHSLEDRIVKEIFRDLAKGGGWRLVNKKPITAGEEELSLNPRARSAKLRVIEKTD